MLLLSCAAAQNAAVPATVQNVTAAREGTDLRIEISLSAPVKPSVETAEHPSRILLDFPETTCSDNTRNISVNVNGVRRVRTGQHSTTPLITRIVLDLDQVHPYVVTTEGNRVILTVGAAEKARSSTHGAPVAATSGNLIGVFRRKRETSVPIADNSEDNSPAPIPPPPARPRLARHSSLLRTIPRRPRLLLHSQRLLRRMPRRAFRSKVLRDRHRLRRLKLPVPPNRCSVPRR